MQVPYYLHCLRSGETVKSGLPTQIKGPYKNALMKAKKKYWRTKNLILRSKINTNHMDFLFANWDVLACVSTWKGADTLESADTSRCRHVPTSLILIIWTFCLQTGMCWHVSAPEKVPSPGKVPTRQGANTCRHVPTSLILIIWTFLFANWDVLACDSTWKSADTKEGADTSRCRHVPTSLILIIWTLCLQTGMCWHVSAPEKVPTPGKVPTRADTSRCRHMPTCAEIPDTNHMNFLLANWDVLACVSTWKSADTWEGADTCRHV